jgi:hypothetical protein
MTLLELLQKLDDKLEILRDHRKLLQGTDAYPALVEAIRMMFSLKVFSARLQSELKKIEHDFPISSGNMFDILGHPEKVNEKITLHGIERWSEDHEGTPEIADIQQEPGFVENVQKDGGP